MSGRILTLFASGAFLLGAAAVPIGVLTSVGSVRMDNAEVRGTGTVVDGSMIETARNPAELSLKNGTRFELSANSRAKVFGDRFELQQGAGQIHTSSGFPVVVNHLSISPAASSMIRVSRIGSHALEVFAVTGQAEVRNLNGLLIAKVFPGSALDFDQQPGGAAGPTQVRGKVTMQNGHYFLTDTTTNAAVELQGDNLDTTVGHCIAVTGSADPSATPAAGASQLIHVANYKQVSCGKVPGAVAGAGGGGGLSTPAIVAIVGGVAVGGSLGGAAAAGAFSGGSRSTASQP